MYDDFKSVNFGLLNINVNEDIAKFESKQPKFFSGKQCNFLTI